MRRSIMVAGMAVLLSVGGAMAQQPANTNRSENTLQERLRPPVAPAQLAPRLTAAERAELRGTNVPVKPAGAVRGRSVAFMIAGAALFVGGLLVDGDVGAIMAISGAGIGAYGLYLHFR